MVWVSAKGNVPLRVAVPLPLSAKLRPGGRGPTAMEAVGFALVFTVNANGVWALALATDLLVKTGAERGLVPDARAGDGSVVITKTTATTAANEIEILRMVRIIPP